MKIKIANASAFAIFILACGGWGRKGLGDGRREGKGLGQLDGIGRRSDGDDYVHFVEVKGHVRDGLGNGELIVPLPLMHIAIIADPDKH